VVGDTGCGLSPDELDSLRAFLPGRKNMNKKRSTGYGLLIAKKNVEAHDGTLTVESSLGKGTRVTISLPMNMKEETDGESSGR
jgi:signal transduction histidine kinase